jgi:hypothetical protein
MIFTGVAHSVPEVHELVAEIRYPRIFTGVAHSVPEVHELVAKIRYPRIFTGVAYSAPEVHELVAKIGTHAADLVWIEHTLYSFTSGAE